MSLFSDFIIAINLVSMTMAINVFAICKSSMLTQVTNKYTYTCSIDNIIIHIGGSIAIYGSLPTFPNEKKKTKRKYRIHISCQTFSV